MICLIGVTHRARLRGGTTRAAVSRRRTRLVCILLLFYPRVERFGYRFEIIIYITCLGIGRGTARLT